MRKVLIFFMLTLFSSVGLANTKTGNLYVGYKTVNFTGKSIQAMVVSDQIPAPTLHFKEGDKVVLIVHNQLNTGTTIHWHGLLLP